MPIKPNVSLGTGEREIALEIYRQKYENFRHFDKLRWQSPGIGLATGSAVLALARESDGLPAWWALLIFGGFSILIFFVMFRIRKGLEKNRDALDTVARIIGDESVPETTPRFGASWWFAQFMLVLGAISLVIALVRFVIGPVA